ncbi:MAG: hypothetical protein DI527_00930 [Chelatococcus sp.]|nr:MAG: hypothetical protein DI527_00930 [Chelatococcus sp.]
MRRETWFWRVKAAQRDLIERCGGVRRAAEIGECSPSWMGKCNTPTEDAFLSLRQKRALEADAGEPVVTRAEAELAGYALGRAGGCGPELPAACPYAAHADLVGEFGDLLGNFAARIRDGVFSRGDGLAIDRDLADVIAKAEAFRLAIARRQAKGEAERDSEREDGR